MPERSGWAKITELGTKASVTLAKWKNRVGCSNPRSGMCTKKRDGRVCVRHWTLDLCRLFVVSSKKLDAYSATVVHFRSSGIFEVLFEIFAQLLNLPEVSFARPTPKILQLFAKSHFRSLFSTREQFPVFLWLCNGTPFVLQTSRTFKFRFEYLNLQNFQDTSTLVWSFFDSLNMQEEYFDFRKFIYKATISITIQELHLR